MRYFLYARRSSDENSNKQLQSLEGQVQECRKAQSADGLAVVAVLEESRSAKQPGRPVFNDMIARIQKGEADAILCYHLDRLSRNPKDSGDLRWLLQEGVIQEIRTPHQVYAPRDSCLITGIETALAEQFIIHHTERVERGMRQKHRKGGFPHRAPEGYLNNRLDKTIEVDPLRFPLLKRAWQLLLTGTCTVPQIHRILHEDWGFKKRPTKRTANERMSLSCLYGLFANPFYAGVARSWGELQPGDWPAMVTMAEFEQAQTIINRPGHIQPHKHLFAYTGLITCSNCGCAITAEISKGHTYYHCTNRRGICNVRGIREELLEQQLEDHLETVTLFPEFAEWAEEVLSREQQEKDRHKTELAAMREKTMADVRRQSDILLTLRLKEQITEEEYTLRREQLRQQEITCEMQARNSDMSVEGEQVSIQNVADFVSHSLSYFRSSSVEEKRFLARQFATEYKLANRQLQVQLHECLMPVLTGREKLNSEQGMLEPLKIGSGKGEKGGLDAHISVWWAILEGIRTTVRERNISFPAWPFSK